MSTPLQVARPSFLSIWANRGFRSLFPASTAALIFLIVFPQLLLVSLAVSETFDLRWGILPQGFTLDQFRQWGGVILKSMLTSLAITIPTVIFALLLGTPVAYALARLDFTGRAWVIELVNLPMVFPPIVLAFGLFQLMRSGMLPNMPSWVMLVLAHTVVATPFVVRPLLVAMQRLDPALEEASLSLGATRMRTFMTVYLPLLLPSLLIGISLAFARSISDFEITLLLVGGDLATLPITIYHAFETGSSRLGAAVAVTANLFALAVIISLESAVKRVKWW